MRTKKGEMAGVRLEMKGRGNKTVRKVKATAKAAGFLNVSGGEGTRRFNLKRVVQYAQPTPKMADAKAAAHNARNSRAPTPK
jgi:hypothetical protein